jgi:hypothetical protein
VGRCGHWDQPEGSQRERAEPGKGPVPARQDCKLQLTR